MTASAHAVVGASIVTLVPDPIISLSLAFVSHFVGDKLPHWDVMTDKHKTKKQIVLQSAADVITSFTLVGVIFVYLLKVADPTLVFLGAFVAQLPDWLELPYFLTGKNFSIFSYNYRLQSWVHDLWFDSRLPAPWGIVTQTIVCFLFLVLVVIKK